MTMTAKDFKEIANIIAAEANKPGPSNQVGDRIVVCHNVAVSIADYAEQINPRFDRERFMKACKVFREEIEIQVCPDCAIWIANADHSGIDDFDKFMKMVETENACENGKYDIVITGGETYWSASKCDFCGDLHGNRIEAVLIER